MTHNNIFRVYYAVDDESEPGEAGRQTGGITRWSTRYSLWVKRWGFCVTAASAATFWMDSSSSSSTAPHTHAPIIGKRRWWYRAHANELFHFKDWTERLKEILRNVFESDRALVVYENFSHFVFYQSCTGSWGLAGAVSYHLGGAGGGGVNAKWWDTIKNHKWQKLGALIAPHLVATKLFWNYGLSLRRRPRQRPVDRCLGIDLW